MIPVCSVALEMKGKGTAGQAGPIRLVRYFR